MGLLNLQNFRDQLNESLGDRGIGSTSLDRYINNAYFDIAGAADFEELRETEDIDTSPGVWEYEFDIDGLVEIDLVANMTQNKGLSWVHRAEFFRLSREGVGEPRFWVRYGNKILIHPNPNSAYILRVFYRVGPEKLTDTTDVTKLPAIWDQGVYLLAMSYAYYALGEEDRGSAWFNRFLVYVQTRVTQLDIKLGSVGMIPTQPEIQANG